jgi:hypothetical protein
MRLVRTLCPKCKDPYQPSGEELRLLGLAGRDLRGMTLYRPVGCEHCSESGFRGRIGVFEILDINDPIRRLITSSAPESMIRSAALESGMVPIGQDGMGKVLAGQTSLEELQRVVYCEEELARLCPSCHETVSSEFLYCPHCGSAATHVCPRCERRVDPAWSYCPGCGEQRKDAPLVGAQPGGLEPMVGASAVEPRPVSESHPAGPQRHTPRNGRDPRGARRGA